MQDISDYFRDMKALIITALALSSWAACTNPDPEAPGSHTAHFTATAPVLDGVADEACWKNAKAYPMDQLWVGKLPHAMDYMGRFKVCWDSSYLYILAEVYDDSLIDSHANGLDRYWDDDCLEIFVDENASGGNHQYNYNAFAYHISLDGKFVDMGTDSLPHYYNEHGKLGIKTAEHKTVWEVALKLYPDTYKDSAANMPVTLAADKIIGFAVAYNDNDKGEGRERESMMGSIEVTPNPDKNRGWIDAGVFGKLKLVR